MNQTVSKINATERTSQDALVEFFVAQTGITSPTQVAEMLRVPVETARRWMRRYRMNRSDMNGHIRPLNQDSDKACRFDRSDMTKPCRFDRSDLNAAVPSPPLKKKGLPHTPSKEKTTPPLPPPTPDRELHPEIAGLNGSTKGFVTHMARALNEHAPDYDTTYNLLADMAETYGAEAFSIGVGEFKAALVQRRARPDLALLSRFCLKASQAIDAGKLAQANKEANKQERAKKLALLRFG